jgi:hypothetical protein
MQLILTINHVGGCHIMNRWENMAKKLHFSLAFKKILIVLQNPFWIEIM